ncbi:hypothetical protein [Longispora albida]|uniref:hypothetical protein n=1 Tax=Longispora albida TaxID=203523 RepID=UPI0012FB3243|nr:hypothetical protein [Longispora albida]
MRDLDSRDPQVWEDAFHDLSGRAGEFVLELVAEFRRAQREDPGRCWWLLELLGDASSSSTALTSSCGRGPGAAWRNLERKTPAGCCGRTR